ncbi:aspartate aminotransferase family protein [Burkholderia alba]|uniref:aspartate aminotransferase family protein n=1 Tax=Burkholderia alba TaxID=2683677 RepID=UPI002B055754|nr:aspartate aminotransferase family protein [Burkholderia alba]
MSYSESRFWHPRQHPLAASRPPVRIVRGEGCYLYDDTGRPLLDAVASLFNVYVGHGRAEIKEAIVKQLDELEYHPVFAGFSHPRAEELSSRIVGMLQPEDMRRVIFGSGGSDAVEAALMIARQYWKVVGQPERTKFIALRQAYHGSHFGGNSVTGNTAYRRNYEPMLSGCFHVETPWIYRNPFTQDPEELGRLCAALVEREIVFQGPDTVAAFIAEPVQGTGGIIVPPANYWPLVREVCDRHGVLLIADEVVTGFGRTGSLFGSRGWGVAPDIMCLAKGVSSGYLPLGATVLNRRIEDAFAANPAGIGTLMHGYTYAGHPIVCAAALANLQIIVDEDLTGNAAREGAYLLERLQPLVDRYPAVGDVRGKGLLVGIDLVKDKASREPIDPSDGYAAALADATRDAGVLIRSLGNRLAIAPPLVINRKEVDEIVHAINLAFERVPRPKAV